MEEQLHYPLQREQTSIDKVRRSDEKSQFVYILHGTVFQNRQDRERLSPTSELIRSRFTLNH